MPYEKLRIGTTITGILRIHDAASKITYDVKVKGNVIHVDDKIIKIALTEQLNWTKTFALTKNQLVSILPKNIIGIENH